MKSILAFHQEKDATRSESKQSMATIGLANVPFYHSLERFPLVTTRKISYEQTFAELRAFLLGYETQEEFESVGCTFWKPWAKADGSFGPIYGSQWVGWQPSIRSGKLETVNQLQYVLDCLRDRPTDRRMVVSAWRPDETHLMALPPCHLMFVVTPYAGQLNLSWIQRSCDWPVGVPHNIASYALLAHLLAKWSGLRPGSISALFCDAHIYKNQIPVVEQQILRKPKELPTIEIRQSETDFHDWEVKVVGYDYHPHLEYKVTV